MISHFVIIMDIPTFDINTDNWCIKAGVNSISLRWYLSFYTIVLISNIIYPKLRSKSRLKVIKVITCS